MTHVSSAIDRIQGMVPNLDSIDVQKTREILDRLADDFGENSEEGEALLMAWFALFHGWTDGKFGNYRRDCLSSTENESL